MFVNNLFFSISHTKQMEKYFSLRVTRIKRDNNYRIKFNTIVHLEAKICELPDNYNININIQFEIAGKRKVQVEDDLITSAESTSLLIR